MGDESRGQEAGVDTLVLRGLYLVLSYLLAPLVVGFLVWRGLWNRAYWDHFGERFGYARVTHHTPSIWVHAVSVGEVQASAPLVRALARRYPQWPIVVTTITPTGAQRVVDLFGDQVTHVYAPYDGPGAVRRFFDRVNPRLAIVIETELWPNLFHECGRRRVPLVLASARISPRSLGKYRRFTGLFRAALAHGIVIAAQSERDAERFKSLGANPLRTHVTGNIKFDFELPPGLEQQGLALRSELAGERPVWVAASTHAGEEERVIEAFYAVRRSEPRCLLVLVPRHPERFEAVRSLLANRRLRTVVRSSGKPCGADTDVYLVDTLGELILFYAASHVAFVGGSLVPIGGHNLLEPAALGVPMITGPHNFNAQEIADLLVDCGAARKVADTRELAVTVNLLLADPDLRVQIGARAHAAVQANRGALDRLLALVAPLLDAGGLDDECAEQLSSRVSPDA